VVTERPLYPGEMAAAGTPLMTVMDISSVVARAHIRQTSAFLLKAWGHCHDKVNGSGRGHQHRQAHHRESLAGKSGARSQQHNRRSMGAGKKTPASA